MNNLYASFTTYAYAAIKKNAPYISQRYMTYLDRADVAAEVALLVCAHTRTCVRTYARACVRACMRACMRACSVVDTRFYLL